MVEQKLRLAQNHHSELAADRPADSLQVYSLGTNAVTQKRKLFSALTLQWRLYHSLFWKQPFDSVPSQSWEGWSW